MLKDLFRRRKKAELLALRDGMDSALDRLRGLTFAQRRRNEDPSLRLLINDIEETTKAGM